MQAKSEQLLIVFNGNPLYVYLYVGIVFFMVRISCGRLGQSRVLTITVDSSTESRKPDRMSLKYKKVKLEVRII